MTFRTIQMRVISIKDGSDMLQMVPNSYNLLPVNTVSLNL